MPGGLFYGFIQAARITLRICFNDVRAVPIDIKTLAERASWLEFDLDALVHNLGLVRKAAGEAHIIAALKADGYGHGAATVARCLASQGVHSLATGSVADARAIRTAGIDLPLLLFGGPLPSALSGLVQEGFIPTVYDKETAEAVSSAGIRNAPIYVKVDSGLGRLGVRLDRAVEFIGWAANLPNVALAGVYTHLSFADLDGMDWSQQRLAHFDRLLEALEDAGIQVPISQAIASSALLAGLKSQANAVCPGHLLYGLSPVGPEVASATEYRPVFSALKSLLIHVNTIGEGSQKVGVNRVGVLPLGISDGFSAIRVDQKAHALYQGRRVPILGVSLEHLTIDLSAESNAAVGDEVVLLGTSGAENITLPELAAWQGLRPHQALCAFDGRLRSKYLEAGFG